MSVAGAHTEKRTTRTQRHKDGVAFGNGPF